MIKVWLRYDESATQRTRSGFEVCDRADQFSRVQETFRVEIGERNNHADRHNPISVAGYLVDAQETLHKLDPTDPQLYDESVPYQNFPDTGAPARWLIPLGAVRWQPNSDPNQPGAFAKRSEDDLKFSRSLRRYIGVVAEALEAADGRIRLKSRANNYSPVVSQDLVWVEGDLRVEGDVRLFNHKLDFMDSSGLDNNGIPLSIQRADVPGASGSLQAIIGKADQGANTFAVGPLDSSNKFAAKLTVRDDGKVGIGTLTPGYTLDVAGDLRISGSTRKPGGGSWTDSSDLRLKKHVEPLTDALSKLLQLRGVRFEWMEPEKMGNLTGTQMGLVAQEVTAVFPEWISTSPDGYQEITIRGFEALTVEALRELKAEIESLKARLPELGTQTKETPQ